MNWKVRWRRSAKNDLAQAWMDAPNRAAITAAANRIDALIANDPLGVGESREGNRRILIEVPLGVSYTVDLAAQKVLVTHVWRIASRSQDD